MKRIIDKLKLLLVAVMIVSLVSAGFQTPARAAEVASGNCGAAENGNTVTTENPATNTVKWVLDSDGTLTISGNGAIADYDWNTTPFCNMKEIKDVIICEGVTRIGRYAFFNCDNSMDTVSIPSTVKSIGNYAFYSSENLKTITIAEGVETIGNRVFEGCTSLERITIPASVKTMGGPDYEWSSEGAFWGCASLKEVTFLNTATNINTHRMFWKCVNLERVTLPQNYVIKNGMFFGCEKLKYINATEEKNVNLPENTTVIPVYSLEGMKAIDELNIPEGVTEIGAEAFCGSYFKTINLPSSLAAIAGTSFMKCSKLETIKVSEGNTSFKVENGLLLNYEGTHVYASEIAESYVLPGTVTSINKYAFGTQSSNIILSDNIELTNSYTITEGTSQVLNLNGNTLSKNGDVALVNNGILTIKGGTNNVLVVNNGTVISDCLLTVQIDSETVKTFKPIAGGTVEVKGDTVTLTTKDGTRYSGSISENTIPAVNESGQLTIPAGAMVTSPTGVTNTVETTISNLDLTSHIHTWNEGVVTVQPTTYLEGERKYVCTGCAEPKTETIPRLKQNSNAPTDSVKTDPEGTVTVTIEKSTVTKDGNTVVTVTEDVAQKLENSISEGKDVIIKATSKENTSAKPAVVKAGTSLELGVPETTVKALAEKNVSNLVIKSDNAAISLDKSSIKAVADKAGDDGLVKLVVEVVKAEESEVVVDLKLVTSKGTVSDFKGGNVSVTIAVDKELQNDNLVCVYIDSEGIYHKVDGTLNDDGTYTFVTGHFSTYAVMDKAAADKVIADQFAEIKASTLKLKSVKGKGYVRLTWTKSGKYSLDGYEVYRGKTKASMKKWGTVKKTSYRNAKHLKMGNKYYYKVRGYKVVDGKKIYTKWSNICYRRAI